MSTPKNITTHQSKTQISFELIAYTHSFLLRKAVPQTEEQWAESLCNIGLRFAEDVSKMFPQKKQQFIKNILLKTEPKPKEPNNFFWMWWRIKYMQHDYWYVNTKMYKKGNNDYTFYKNLMVADSLLKTELINMLSSNQII
jgi:hypothetical protein